MWILKIKQNSKVKTRYKLYLCFFLSIELVKNTITNNHGDGLNFDAD